MITVCAYILIIEDKNKPSLRCSNVRFTKNPTTVISIVPDNFIQFCASISLQTNNIVHTEHITHWTYNAPKAKFRLEHFFKVLELTYLGKYFAYQLIDTWPVLGSRPVGMIAGKHGSAKNRRRSSPLTESLEEANWYHGRHCPRQ